MYRNLARANEALREQINFYDENREGIKKGKTSGLFFSEAVLAGCSIAFQDLLSGYRNKMDSGSITAVAKAGCKRAPGIILRWYCIGQHFNPRRNKERKEKRIRRFKK